MPRKAGFTLTEVLVVLFILCLLIAISLPAIQSVRETSRRLQCTNNLRQIALAVGAYESADRQLPALYNGPLGKRVWPLRAFRLHSWRTIILPYLEEQALFQSLDFSVEATHRNNLSAIKTPLALYLCPSVPRSSVLVGGIPDSGGTPDDPSPPSHLVSAAATDYQATAAVRWRPQSGSDTNPSEWNYGAWGEPVYDALPFFSKTRALSWSDIRDGLSRTTLVCESAGRPDWYQRGKPPLLYNPSNPSAAHPGPSASTWALSSHFPWYVLIAFGTYGRVNESNYEGFYAFHPGGANVALCDGSVQFLSEATDISIIQGLITRNRRD